MRQIHITLLSALLAFQCGCNSGGGGSKPAVEVDRAQQIFGPNGECTNVADVNDAGDVVGSYVQNGLGHPFLWRDGVAADLGSLGGTVDTRWGNSATGINNNGQVCGYSTTTAGHTHAFILENGVMRDLGTLGGQFSAAANINDRKQIVGCSYASDGRRHPFIWENDIMTDLGTGGDDDYATGLNGIGQVVGRYTIAKDVMRGFLWENGVLHNIGLPDGASESDSVHAIEINISGVIAGSYIVGTKVSCFIWEDGHFTIIDNQAFTSAHFGDIDDSSRIVLTAVGYSPLFEVTAFLWEDGVFTDLNEFSESMYLSMPRNMSETGIVVGYTSCGWLLDIH